MTLFDLTVPQLAKTLQNMERWIDKTVEHAKTKKFEPNDLLVARLVPDQLPLVAQFQMACDNAKMIAARLSGKEAPKHPDTEKTWDELRTRLRSVREYLGTYKPSDFEGAETRFASFAWMPGKVLTGADYAREFALQNFYFHVTTAYSILRHNGVELGKADYLGSLPFKDA